MNEIKSFEQAKALVRQATVDTVVTDSGNRYRFRHGGWKQERSPFWLVEGHFYEQNPHF